MTNKAQSEAPSVDDELEKILDRLAVRMYSEGQLDKPSLMGRQVAIVNINEAKSKINRLIVEARIDELKHIDDPVNVRLWFDGFYGVDDRIKLLSNNLSKGKDNEG